MNVFRLVNRVGAAARTSVLLGLLACGSCAPEVSLEPSSLQEFARLCAGGKLTEAEALSEALLEQASAASSSKGPLESLADRVLGPSGVRKASRLAAGMGLAEPAPMGRTEKVDDTLEARLRWTLGAARAREGAVETAETDFQAVRGSGDSQMRQHGMYGLGWIDLDLAEQIFDTIPEVKGASNNAMSPGFQPPAPTGEDGADPLPLARKAYEAALEHYLERLQADWRDADTRANVEWIQRRLREIEKIEQERTQDEGTDRSQDDPQEQDKQEQDEQSESSGDQGAPSDEEQEEEPQDSSEESEEDQEGDQQDSESENEEEASEQEEESEGEQEGEPQELHLTDEQMKRLLETLMQHNKEGEELREVMQSQGRQSTDRDW